MGEHLRSMQWDELIRSKPLAAALGLVSHYILNNGEWDHHTYLLIPSGALAFSALTVLEYQIDPRINTISAALGVVGVTAAVYFGTLFTSIIIYRAFFHRLRKFPGPFPARISKWYSIFRVLPASQNYIETEAMHRRFNSDIIRTGPRELSVAYADAVPLINGPMSRCRKSSWYSGAYFLEGSSVHTTRDKQDHRERRKNWDRAFNAKSLREYEPRLNRHALALMEKLKERADQPSLRISDWINFYSFDVMGDVGFSRSFGMMEKGKEDPIIKQLHESMAPFAYVSHLVWVVGVLLRIGGAKDLVQFIDWTQKILRERKKIIPPENDVFGFLLDPDEEDIPKNRNADARLMIVAGSDTTAATLTWLVYELCMNPDAQAKLRKIVDDIEPGKSFLDADDVANCPHLDGVINESMRLHPAVPSGVQRETPPEGLALPDGRFIPGETLVWTTTHTMQRDPRYFPEPLKYIPERWTNEKPDYLVDKRAFTPFSLGIYSCVGQKLAMMEMRSVTANLVRNFEVSFVGNDVGASVVKNTKDCFTLNVGSLDVKLTPRYKA